MSEIDEEKRLIASNIYAKINELNSLLNMASNRGLETRIEIDKLYEVGMGFPRIYLTGRVSIDL